VVHVCFGGVGVMAAPQQLFILPLHPPLTTPVTLAWGREQGCLPSLLAETAEAPPGGRQCRLFQTCPLLQWKLLQPLESPFSLQKSREQVLQQGLGLWRGQKQVRVLPMFHAN
jgi:hypothetical protein